MPGTFSWAVICARHSRSRTVLAVRVRVFRFGARGRWRAVIASGVMRWLTLLVVLAACGGRHVAVMDAPADDAAGRDSGSAGDPTLSGQYPGDVGLGDDPGVVWFEDFEEGSVAAVDTRYDQTQGDARKQLVSDHVGGAAALALTAGGAVSAVDLYKQLPDRDEWYVRWYAKYQAGVTWHHSGMWVGGYDPAMPYPSPMAGYKPTGDDRFSIAVEPAWGIGTASARFDFYDYWMEMHSWMDTVTNDGTSYYGNSLAHTDAVDDRRGHVGVPRAPRPHQYGPASSGAGSILELWKNDAPMVRFADSGPPGYWIRDKFCTVTADGTECTDYPAAATDTLDLQVRSTTAYGLNAFWPQNYVTDPNPGTLELDQMVVATRRIGCMR